MLPQAEECFLRLRVRVQPKTWTNDEKKKCEWLCKNIYKLILEENKMNLNIFICNLVMYKVKISLHMFRTSMENRIRGDISRAKVIIPKGRSIYWRQMTSIVPSTNALYSASVEERATVHCLLDFHEIGVWSKKIR